MVLLQNGAAAFVKDDLDRIPAGGFDWKLIQYIVASELKDLICHSNECQIGSFSSEATIYQPLLF